MKCQTNKTVTFPRSRRSPPAPETAEPVVSDLDMLKFLMAKFSKAEIVKLTKEVAADKATVLSVTMDAIVAAGDTLVSATVNDKATELGLEAGVFNAGEKASPVSTAQLIRHVQAYRAAVKRSEASKAEETTDNEEMPLDVSKLNPGEPGYVEAPAS